MDDDMTKQDDWTAFDREPPGLNTEIELIELIETYHPASLDPCGGVDDLGLSRHPIRQPRDPHRYRLPHLHLPMTR
jgi:hypothetical protein